MGPYESDGRRMDVRLGLEDRVIAQLYTFDKAFGASGCACLSTVHANTNFSMN